MLYRALLLPLVALALVAGALVAVLVMREGDTEPRRPASSDDDGAAQDEPTAAPTGSSRPQLRPEGNVCQGILHRPDPGAPRIFPDIYTQRAEMRGITVVATAEVDTRALAVARQTIERMFADNDLEEPLAEQGAYVVVADSKQSITDLPEFGCVADAAASRLESACGVADRADCPVVTVNELDLLGSRNGPCGGVNILYHELGHLVQGWALAQPDYIDVRLLYQSALDAGKYRNFYARTNFLEYFAEVTQAFFASTDPGGRYNRPWLKEYDPEMYALIARVYGE